MNLSDNKSLDSHESQESLKNVYSDLKSSSTSKDSDYFDQQKPEITVIGVGGGGGNAVNNMIRCGLGDDEIRYIAVNTDAQALRMSEAEHRIQLGPNLTKGFGAGGSPDVGRESAIESKAEIMSHLANSDMIFITAGLGGGTGTGAAPMIAQYLREMRDKMVTEHGAQYGLSSLSIGVVTKPFDFEGKKKARIAQKGLEEMKKYVDTLIVVPNQNLFKIANEKTTFKESFAKADEVLGNAIRCISGLITDAGLINVDFADVRAVLSERGKAVIGIGYGTGENRAITAALDAMSNPILDQVSLRKAKALLVSITGGDDLTLFEIDEALSRIRDEIDKDANIIFGSVYDASKTGSIFVSVVATGIEDDEEIPSIENVAKRKQFYQFDEKAEIIQNVQDKSHNEYNELPKQNSTLDLNLNDQNILLEIDEKLEKLGIYQELQESKNQIKPQKQSVFAKFGLDIPAYLRKRKNGD